MATDWFLENTCSYRKGKPNMTLLMFCQWVNNELLMNCNLHVPIGFHCSSHHALLSSFRPFEHKKGTFVDAHERPDFIIVERCTCI